MIDLVLGKHSLVSWRQLSLSPLVTPPIIYRSFAHLSCKSSVIDVVLDTAIIVAVVVIVILCGVSAREFSTVLSLLMMYLVVAAAVPAADWISERHLGTDVCVRTQHTMQQQTHQKITRNAFRSVSQQVLGWHIYTMDRQVRQLLDSTHFCSAMLCKSAAYAVMRCPSVCLSVRHVRGLL